MNGFADVSTMELEGIDGGGGTLETVWTWVSAASGAVAGIASQVSGPPQVTAVAKIVTWVATAVSAGSLAAAGVSAANGW